MMPMTEKRFLFDKHIVKCNIEAVTKNVVEQINRWVLSLK